MVAMTAIVPRIDTCQHSALKQEHDHGKHEYKWLLNSIFAGDDATVLLLFEPAPTTQRRHVAHTHTRVVLVYRTAGKKNLGLFVIIEELANYQTEQCRY